MNSNLSGKYTAEFLHNCNPGYVLYQIKVGKFNRRIKITKPVKINVCNMCERKGGFGENMIRTERGANVAIATRCISCFLRYGSEN